MRQTCSNNVDWTDLAKLRNHLQALVLKLMKL